MLFSVNNKIEVTYAVGGCGESNLRFSFFQYYFAVFSFCVSVILRGAISLANLRGMIICD